MADFEGVPVTEYTHLLRAEALSDEAKLDVATTFDRVVAASPTVTDSEIYRDVIAEKLSNGLWVINGLMRVATDRSLITLSDAISRSTRTSLQRKKRQGQNGTHYIRTFLNDTTSLDHPNNFAHLL